MCGEAPSQNFSTASEQGETLSKNGILCISTIFLVADSSLDNLPLLMKRCSVENVEWQVQQHPCPFLHMRHTVSSSQEPPLMAVQLLHQKLQCDWKYCPAVHWHQRSWHGTANAFPRHNTGYTHWNPLLAAGHSPNSAYMCLITHDSKDCKSILCYHTTDQQETQTDSQYPLVMADRWPLLISF